MFHVRSVDGDEPKAATTPKADNIRLSIDSDRNVIQNMVDIVDIGGFRCSNGFGCGSTVDVVYELRRRILLLPSAANLLWNCSVPSDCHNLQSLVLEFREAMDGGIRMMGPPSGSSTAAVQATNDDATASKLSCVTKGYISDEFVHLFVRRSVKRAPIINRGYYARWATMRMLLLQFLDSNIPDTSGLPLKKQILSLGAGFDTSFFQLVGEGRAPHKYVEVDFVEVTKKKTALIASKEVLLSKLGSEKPEIDPGKGEIVSEHYSLLPCDLRVTKDLDAAFAKAGLDAKLPTLIFAECVLIYMDPAGSRQVVKWTADRFETAAFVIYEQILPDDAFGQQMLKNLESRGCSLLGLHDTPTLESKEKRFTDLGYQKALALDMDAIYHQQLDPIDRGRIERLEIFDEFEEWNIMQAHYCVAYGVKDNIGAFDNFGFSVKKGTIIEKPVVPMM